MNCGGSLTPTTPTSRSGSPAGSPPTTRSCLCQRPDTADGVTRVRAEMAEADRAYAVGIAALLQAAELTQAELARRLGVTQAAAISRIEQLHDLLLSTLNSYLGAIGGRASVIVTFADGHQTTLDLSQLT